MIMVLKEIQKEVDEWVSQYKMGYWKPHDNLAHLTEELGELAREINHRFGPKKKKDTEEDNEISDEIADIIFTLVCLANSQNIDLDLAFEKKMEKSYTRDKDRFEKKEIA